jgi:hypothetical protein
MTTLTPLTPVPTPPPSGSGPVQPWAWIRATGVGSGGTGGSLPDVTTIATSRFAVTEAQAVIVK